MIYVVADYGKRREELLRNLTPDVMDGLTGTVLMTPEERKRLAADIAAISDLAEQTRSYMKDVFDRSVEILGEFKSISQKYFNDPAFPSPKIVDKAVETGRREQRENPAPSDGV